MEIITNNPYLSAADLVDHVKLSTEGVRHHIKNLKKKSKIRRKGHAKGGHWEIIHSEK